MSDECRAVITANGSPRGEPARLIVAAPTCYTCPGETQPISRAVHYARLAAFYPKCRQCEHRRDTGSLPRQIVERIDRTSERIPRVSLVTQEGVRGVYLNEMGRGDVERYASAFASLLWEDQPLVCRTSDVDAEHRSQRLGPTVVVGRDARESSPEMVVAAASALRRMGCRVVDVGIVSPPCFAFAVEHLQAAGGVHVTGSGCGPSTTGLDFWGRGAIPWSAPGTLNQIDQQAAGGVPRPTRRGGDQRSLKAVVPYAASLLKHFHALRPLRIGIASAAEIVQLQLQELFEGLPCRLTPIPFPVADDVSRASELATERVAGIVRDQSLHFGFVIADDAQTCRIVDEEGRRLPVNVLAENFARLALEESSAPSVLFDESLYGELSTKMTAAGCRVAMSDGTRESMARGLMHESAMLGVESCGRYWFGGRVPVCDAIVTLARLLQLLSRSDRPCSSLRNWK